jgi:hypothetical protein
MCCSHAKLALPDGGLTVDPARVIIIDTCIPFLHVEGRVGHYKISAQVGVLVVGIGVGGLFAEIKINATDRHVHGGELPCGVVVFLAVDRNITDLAFVRRDELF